MAWCQKIFGTRCIVQVDTAEVTGLLPRSADSNGLVYVKLKRKVEYHGHVLFEPVRPPVFLDRLLRFLKETHYMVILYLKLKIYHIANETYSVSLNPQTSTDNDCINIAPHEQRLK